ncbi:hypothetical protein PRIEUP_LOCUS1059, partial [Pristimantis euphronides]
MAVCGDLGGGQRNDGPALGRVRTLLLLVLCHTCCAVEITVLPSQVGIVQTNAVLYCTFKVKDYPINVQYLAVFWHYGDKEIARYDRKTTGSTSRFTIDEQMVKQGNASLTIHNVTISDQGTYKCTVVYSPNNEEKQIQLNVLAVPAVRLQQRAVQRGVRSLLQCSITNFFPKDMKVIWLENDQIFGGSVTQDDTENVDKTFSRISSINVTFLKERDNPKMTCQVEHEYLKDPIKDSYVVQYGVPPTVSIKASKTPDGNDQIYMCEATNYFPKAVTMHWLLDGKRIDSPQQTNNERFTNGICYRIPLDGNNPPSQISCEVQHETLSNSIMLSEEVKVERECKRSCHFGLMVSLVGLLLAVQPLLWFLRWRGSQQFQVGDIHRMPAAGGKVTLYCTAFNCPKDVQVTWTILEKDKEKIVVSNMKQEGDEEAALVVSSDYSVKTDQSHSDKFHYAVSTLSFTPTKHNTTLKSKEMEFFCKFHCDRRSIEKSLKSSFTIEKPDVCGSIQLSLADNGDVLCSLSLRNLYSTDIKIAWSHGHDSFQVVETIHQTFTKNDDCTFIVTSGCRVPGDLFKEEGFRVRANWSHESESGQQEVSIKDSDWHPAMGEIEKPPFLDGKEAKLLCRVSGYFLDVLDVKWLRRDAGSQKPYVVSAGDKYKIPVTEATQQEDKTFTYTACLIVSVSLTEDDGAEFICQVGHPSLETPEERRTGQLQVIGE